MTELTERQKKALELKGKNKIYYEDQTADHIKRAAEEGCTLKEMYGEGWENIRIIADLDEVEIISMTEAPKNLDGRAYIPDHTPSWLYEILELWDADEEMESVFLFNSKEDADEFKAICDVVNE